MSASTHQFCVRWNSHLGSFGVAIPQLLATRHFVDVTLACEGHRLFCHRLVLAACSSYFETLLSENPCKHPIIILPPDIKLWAVQALVDFMYKGEVNVSQCGLPDLIHSAEILKIRGLCGTDVANLKQVVNSANNAPAPQSSHSLSCPSESNETPELTSLSVNNGTSVANSKKFKASTNNGKNKSQLSENLVQTSQLSENHLFTNSNQSTPNARKRKQGVSFELSEQNISNVYQEGFNDDIMVKQEPLDIDQSSFMEGVDEGEEGGKDDGEFGSDGEEGGEGKEGEEGEGTNDQPDSDGNAYNDKYPDNNDATKNSEDDDQQNPTQTEHLVVVKSEANIVKNYSLISEQLQEQSKMQESGIKKQQELRFFKRPTIISNTSGIKKNKIAIGYPRNTIKTRSMKRKEIKPPTIQVLRSLSEQQSKGSSSSKSAHNQELAIIKENCDLYHNDAFQWPSLKDDFQTILIPENDNENNNRGTLNSQTKMLPLFKAAAGREAKGVKRNTLSVISRSSSDHQNASKKSLLGKIRVKSNANLFASPTKQQYQMIGETNILLPLDNNTQLEMTTTKSGIETQRLLPPSLKFNKRSMSIHVKPSKQPASAASTAVFVDTNGTNLLQKETKKYSSDKKTTSIVRTDSNNTGNSDRFRDSNTDYDKTVKSEFEVHDESNYENIICAPNVNALYQNDENSQEYTDSKKENEYLGETFIRDDYADIQIDEDFYRNSSLFNYDSTDQEMKSLKTSPLNTNKALSLPLLLPYPTSIDSAAADVRHFNTPPSNLANTNARTLDGLEDCFVDIDYPSNQEDNSVPITTTSKRIGNSSRRMNQTIQENNSVKAYTSTTNSFCASDATSISSNPLGTAINSYRRELLLTLTNGSPSPAVVVLRNPRSNQPRTYSTEALPSAIVLNNRSRKYSKETLYAALMDVKSGESVNSTSIHHKVPEITLRSWMKKFGIKSAYSKPFNVKRTAHKPKSYNEITLIAALLDVKSGESVNSTSKLYKVPRNTLQNWMNKFGIKSAYAKTRQLR